MSVESEIKQLEQMLREQGGKMNALQIVDIKEKIQALKSGKCRVLAEEGNNE
ncbi:hypothetical protein [uncultured Fibrobacter sp.]|uniref:hypothetical protein n=1 Tax=uncultured Fibrobacter sp. TaxID=261512 RepID=UPI0026193EF3|nr:hypothetical protein [uncultured Fibrobacter sp.]